MKQFLGPAWLIVALSSAFAANAQTVAPAQTAAPQQTAAPAPTVGPAQPPIVPGSLSGAAEHAPLPAPAGAPSPATAVEPASAAPEPAPSPTSSSRFHLHRPGTDVDGDLLSGNSASGLYVFRGNVILHSNPKIDTEFGATESDEPITVTADEIDIDRFAATYVAKGHVHFVQGDRSGRADVAMLNEQTQDLDLLGNADVLEGDHRARAAKMYYNIADRRFHGSGDVRIYEPAPTPNPQASATSAPKHRRRLPF
jgi:lipopolysaccharide export system protein LptA